MAQQHNSERGAVLSMEESQVIASALLQVGIKMVQGPAAGRQERCSIYFPPANFTALYEREEKHFVHLQRNWDVSQEWFLLPLGGGVQRALFFPVQNVFLDKGSVQMCCVSSPQLCFTQGTLWQPNTGSGWPCKRTHHLFNLKNFPSIRVTHSDPPLRALEGPRSRLQSIHPSPDLGSG